MQKYTHPFVPGPTFVPKEIAECYLVDYASSDIEDEFFDLYDATRTKIKRIFHASGDVVIQSGEAMVVLWGAMKSVLQKGDKVLAIGTVVPRGFLLRVFVPPTEYFRNILIQFFLNSLCVYGDGIGEMAQLIGPQVEYVKFDWDESASDIDRIRQAALTFKPKLVTMVHSETPCGTINPCEPIGKIAREVGALFYVDFVSSGGGMEINVDAWNIDLGLLGTQKCLSMPPDLGIVTVSERASTVIDEVNYIGYDALKPWKGACEKKYFPYTHNWRAIAALSKSLDLLESEGLENVYRRHQECKELCIKRIKDMGLKIFPKSEEISSPTVTAVYTPDGWTWKDLDSTLRANGVCFGGSYGKIADKVFRIGHMGVQAHLGRLSEALDTLEKVFKSKSS